MTELEAFSRIDDWVYGHHINNDNENIEEAMKTIHQVVLKSIPKKPIDGKLCPTCRAYVVQNLGSKKVDYCIRCGQAIAWK